MTSGGPGVSPRHSELLRVGTVAVMFVGRSVPRGDNLRAGVPALLEVDVPQVAPMSTVTRAARLGSVR